MGDKGKGNVYRVTASELAAIEAHALAINSQAHQIAETVPLAREVQLEAYDLARLVSAIQARGSTWDDVPS